MHAPTREEQIRALEQDWAENPRWKGIRRTLLGGRRRAPARLASPIEHTLARRGAEKLWNLVNTEPFVNTLGALTGNQAMQQVKAGLKAIYLSGWQVAGDANIAGEMYPDQSLYPANSVPMVVKRINNTFTRADQIQWSEGKDDIDYFAPIVADAEAGFGGVLERLRADEVDDRGRRRRASTSRTSSRRSRSAATWAARCSCRRAKPSPSSPPRASRPTSWACRPSSSPAPMPKPPTS